MLTANDGILLLRNDKVINFSNKPLCHNIAEWLIKINKYNTVMYNYFVGKKYIYMCKEESEQCGGCGGVRGMRERWTPATEVHYKTWASSPAWLLPAFRRDATGLRNTHTHARPGGEYTTLRKPSTASTLRPALEISYYLWLLTTFPDL